MKTAAPEDVRRQLEPMRAAMEKALVLAAYLAPAREAASRHERATGWLGLLFDRPTPRMVQSQMLLARRISEALEGDGIEVVVLNDQTDEYLQDRLHGSLRVHCVHPGRVRRFEERSGLISRGLREEETG